MRSIASALLLGCLACGLTACATSGATPPPQRAKFATVVDAQCAAGTTPSRYREMTWNEYYARVRERAWRKGALVVWLNPPRVRKVAVSPAHATACK